MTGSLPTCSVVICTDGRRASLQDALRGLEGLTSEGFEVCIVLGPTEDGSAELLARYGGRIKTARSRLHNLSVSRNLGIALAAGEVIAFLDDDAVPSPEWLAELLPPYGDPAVGAAGGFVLGPDGIHYQYRFGVADRLGDCSRLPLAPMPELCFPLAANYPHLLGANCSFRRAALVAIGGFDEEYEYFLDETDVCCRVIDAGWRIAQVAGARVYHRYRESSYRTEREVLRRWYPIVKNKLYFALMNGARHYGVRETVQAGERFVARLESDLRWAIAANLLEPDALDRFKEEVDRAIAEGSRRGLSGRRRLPPGNLSAPPLLPFVARAAAAPPRVLVLLSREYPPGPVGGIGRYTESLAEAAVQLGASVHVISRAATEEALTYRNGVWVHRVAPDPDSPLRGPAADILAYARATADAVAEIAERHPIAQVLAPIWDVEGLMVLRDHRVPLTTSLHTPFSVWCKTADREGRRLPADPAFTRAMLALEREVLSGSRRIIANSQAIVAEMGEELPAGPARLSVIPHGLPDLARLPREVPAPLPPGTLRVLCVARLEPRKGVDTLLEAALLAFAQHPDAILDLVGEDGLRLSNGKTLRASFEARALAPALRSRIRFHGVLSGPALLGFLAAADIAVVPSRFESFGLTALEAMIFAKPLLCSRAGGLVEVVAEDETALLAEAGDAASFAAQLGRLLDSPALRARLGAGGRARYERLFSARVMAERVLAFLDAGEARQGLAAAVRA